MYCVDLFNCIATTYLLVGLNSLQKVDRLPMLLNAGACCATNADATTLSTAHNNNTKTSSVASDERTSSDTVLLQLTARRRQRPTGHLPVSRPADCLRAAGESATDRTEATTPRYDLGKTAMRVTVRGRPRQTHPSARRGRRSVTAAIALTQTPARKHFKPMPSPVDFHTCGVTPPGKDNRRVHGAQRTCPDGVTCRPTMTSLGRLSATKKETQMSSVVRSRVSQPDVVADTGFTPQLFKWLREVNGCLNPNRRHRWSD